VVENHDPRCSFLNDVILICAEPALEDFGDLLKAIKQMQLPSAMTRSQG